MGVKDWISRMWRAPQRKSARGRSRLENFFANWNGSSGFQGAKLDRMTEDWNPQSLSPASLHRMDSVLLRARARDLVMNNPLAKSAVTAYVSNVVEQGITPKPMFDSHEQRRLWTAAWDDWGYGEADITGSQHLYELMATWLEEIIVAGGCLMRFRVMPSGQSRGRRLRAAIELIPEERICDERDTYLIARNNKTGNAISNGVEIDISTGRAVAYWVKPWHPNDSMATGQMLDDPIRIPAEECHYAFIKRRIGQYRGHTLLHAVIMWLWRLGYYTDNELMASAIKSCFAAAIISEGGSDDFPTLAGEEGSGTTDLYGNTMEKIQPAMIARLRPGEDIRAISPTAPSGDSTPWLAMIQRSIAIGADLSYEELVRDYSKGNFSSTRASANADRKRFKPMQRFTINHFCTPVWRHFVNWAVMAGIDGFPTPAQFVSDPDEWLEVNWRPPGWISVNPRDDSQAADIRLANHSLTLDDVCAMEGRDWEDRLEQRARELARAHELEVEYGVDMTSSVMPQPVPDAMDGEGDDGSAP